MCAFALNLVFFFFSSRRRHTRYIGDWSSDVCSSDLGSPPAPTLLTASALAVTRSTEMPPGHHGGPLHPLAGLDRKSGVEGKRRVLGGRPSSRGKNDNGSILDWTSGG